MFFKKRENEKKSHDYQEIEKNEDTKKAKNIELENAKLELEMEIEKAKAEIEDTIIKESEERIKIQSKKEILANLIEEEKQLRESKINTMYDEKMKKIQDKDKRLDKALLEGNIEEIAKLLDEMK